MIMSKKTRERVPVETWMKCMLVNIIIKLCLLSVKCALVSNNNEVCDNVHFEMVPPRGQRTM